MKRSFETPPAIDTLFALGRTLGISDHDLYNLADKFYDVNKEAYGTLEESLLRLNVAAFIENFTALAPPLQEKIQARFQKEFKERTSDLNKFNVFADLCVADSFNEWLEESQNALDIEAIDNAVIKTEIEKIDIAVRKEEKREKLTPEQIAELRKWEQRFNSTLLFTLKITIADNDAPIALLQKHLAWNEDMLCVDKIAYYKKLLAILSAQQNGCTLTDLQNYLQMHHPVSLPEPPKPVQIHHNGQNSPPQEDYPDYEDIEGFEDLINYQTEDEHTQFCNDAGISLEDYIEMTNAPVYTPVKNQQMQEEKGALEQITENVSNKISEFKNYYFG